MALMKTDIKRVVLAGKIADELGLQDVSPILKNISIPYSRLTTCPHIGNTHEEPMTQDSLRHVGVAFSHHGLIKYTDRAGETHITVSCKAVEKELEEAGYTVIGSDLIIDRQSTENAITQARDPETRTSIFGEERTNAKGYGLSETTLEQIEKIEDGKNLGQTGYVPFNGMSCNLGESTSKDDATLLTAFTHYPVEGTLHSIRSTESVEVVEAGLIANAGAIKSNFEDYSHAMYARAYQMPTGQEE